MNETKKSDDGRDILVSNSERFHVQDAPDAYVIADENGLAVGEVYVPYCDEDRPQTLATAQMMAAAPEMLEALGLALAYIADPWPTGGKASIELLINRAIGSATSEG